MAKLFSRLDSIEAIAPRNDLVIEPGKAAFVLGDQDRGEAAIAVARDVYPQRSVVGQHRLAALAVALVGGLLGAIFARGIPQMVA